MKSRSYSLTPLAAVAVLLLGACQDTRQPLEPGTEGLGPQAAVVGRERAAEALREVMALQQTVFGGYDAAGQLVVGVEHAGVARGVQAVLERFGMEPSAYRVEVTEPIHFASTTLRTEHRPTKGGIQIHWSNYVCTLGFNADHAGGRSFITNSHCTTRQGSLDNTAYYQPASSVNSTPIAYEADDPAYTKLAGCSAGKSCRYSDASRALYQAGIVSNAEIAKTTGVNTGSLDTNGHFEVTGEDGRTFFPAGTTVNKVGRTTGWTAGNVTQSCATVNVSGSSIQLLCQTLVQNNDAVIVQGGDSGSPVFTLSGSNATIAGILWGGNSSGSLFVFSPLSNIEDELGALTVTTDGTGGGSGPGDGGGECIPRGKGNNCK